MPSIKDAQNVDMSSFSDAAPVPPPDFQPERSLLPARDPKLRFSAPFLPGTFPSSDTLAGYHIGGVIPQWRIPVPSQASAQGAGAATSTTITTSSSSTTNNPPKSQTTSIASSFLNPGDQFIGQIVMAKSFYILSVAVDNAARVELYSTSLSQLGDLSRASTTAPGLGIQQGIIADWYLDTAPVIWTPTPVVAGSNGDTPQTNVIYLTVTNIGAMSTVINVSFVYVPLQS